MSGNGPPSRASSSALPRPRPGTIPTSVNPARDVEVIELPRDPERPAGARFGALVHATLAAVPLDANPDQVQTDRRSLRPGTWSGRTGNCCGSSCRSIRLSPSAYGART